MSYVIRKGGDQAGLDICQALGIDERQIRRISIELQAGDVSMITIERYMTDKDGERIAKLLKEKYEVILIGTIEEEL